MTATNDDIRRFDRLCRGVVSEFFAPGLEQEDLLQEARLAVAQALRDYRPDKGAALQTFVSLVVRRRVMTVVRMAKAGKHSALNDSIRIVRVDDGGDEAFEIPAPIKDDPEVRVLARERLSEVTEAIDSLLTPVEAKCLRLVAAGYTYEEIAESEVVDRKTIDNAIQRARRKLAQPLTLALAAA